MNNFEQTAEIAWVAPELTIESWEATESVFDFFRCS
jgi:hypothetical protein